MNFCGEVEILRIMLVIKIVLNLITILLPIILMIMIIIDLSKFLINPKEASSLIKMISHRFIAALAVFFVPTLILTVISYATERDLDYNETLCINEATIENIQKLEEVKEAERVKKTEERKKLLAESAQKRPIPESSTIIVPNYNENGSTGNNNSVNNNNTTTNSEIPRSSQMTPFVNGVQKALEKGDCMTYDDNCACPTIGKFSGFYFTMENETGRNMSSVQRTGEDKMVQVKVQCSDGTYLSKTVNNKTKENFENAFNRLCQLRTTGIDGIKISTSNLQIDGTLNERTTSNRKICSPHSYGIAIDINYKLVININGVEYKPYSSQGQKTRQDYDNFVQAIGGENNPQNVNYILWTHVFKPSGFTWGGNWSDGSFDPMHYEVAL